MSDPQSRPALVEALSIMLTPLRAAAQNEDYLRDMAAAIGWDLDAIAGFDIRLAMTNLETLAEDVAAFIAAAQTPPDDLKGTLALLDHAGRAFASVRNLNQILVTANAPSHFEDFGRDLVHTMIASAWQRFSPVSLDVAALLTLIDIPGAVAPAVFEGTRRLRREWPLVRLRLDRLKPLFHDPVALLEETYFGSEGLQTRASAYRVADRLFPRIAKLAQDLGLSACYGIIPGLSITSDLRDQEDFAHTLTIIGIPPDLQEYGATMAFSAEPGLRGLVVRPFGSLAGAAEFGQWKVTLEATEMVGGLLVGDNIEVEGDGALRLKLSAEPLREFDSVSHFGGTKGSAVEFGHVKVEGELALGKTVREAAFKWSVDRLQIRIAPSDGDGFLSQVLPAKGLNAETTVAFGWSNREGFRFHLGMGLDLSFPIHKNIGPLRIESFHLGIRENDQGLSAFAALSAGLTMGPVSVLVDRLGLETQLTFPEAGGNLGAADLKLRFKPPNGVGLTINASMVVGGGFLRFDAQKGEYSGVLELQIAEKISVKGIGLLTTKLPGGGKGFSLVVIIFVENFTPIQLGFGFTLTAIGGLLAINRTFDEDVLRSGLQNHTLDSVMFPKDPIRNAPQIISNLNKVFPPAAGHHLFGPMVQIAWGTPALITANVALVFEFGARRRLLILGQLLAILPKPENDLVRLQMDAVGIIDFDQGNASLDATLHDSRLLHKFVLTGNMAMRMQWKSAQNFALAVGGFHHAFKPPANFPKLERITINLCSGNNPRFRCEAYFALTSNTVQFGARAELYAEAHGFNIQGGVGFDVLIQFDPFYFIAEFDAHIQLRRGSTNLFSIRVKGALSGPRPLHLKAKATFSIFWWDISIPVNLTLVDGEKPPLPEPIEVMPRLKEALGNRGNWVSQLPGRQLEVVTVRANPWAANDVLLHPLGTLTVKQNVVPLNFEISRFGQAPPAGARRFTVSVAAGGFEQSREPVRDFFAPAQFIEMSDDEKLSRPSFEPMEAGLTIGSNRIDITSNSGDWLEVEAIRFETKIMDQELKTVRPGDPLNTAGGKMFYQLSPDLLQKQSRFGAAGNSQTRRSGEAKYRTPLRKHNLSKEGWTMVAVEDLGVRAVPGVDPARPATYSEAEQALRKLKQADPATAAGLKILRPSDLARG